MGIQHVMFAFIWASKLNANPWWRKPMHLKHHKTSGQVDDIEERLIGLGLPLGFKRLAVTLSPLGSFLVMNGVAKDSKAMDSKPLLHIMWTSLLNLPVVLPSHLCLALLWRYSRKERVLPESSDRPLAVLSSASVLLQLWSVSHSSSLRHSPAILSSPNVCASSDAHSAGGGSSVQRSGDLCSGSSLFQRALHTRHPTSGSIISYGVVSSCYLFECIHKYSFVKVKQVD